MTGWKPIPRFFTASPRECLATTIRPFYKPLEIDDFRQA
jgi:hypothetical protein